VIIRIWQCAQPVCLQNVTIELPKGVAAITQPWTQTWTQSQSLWVLAYFLAALCWARLLCRGGEVIAWLYFYFSRNWRTTRGSGNGNTSTKQLCVIIIVGPTTVAAEITKQTTEALFQAALLPRHSISLSWQCLLKMSELKSLPVCSWKCNCCGLRWLGLLNCQRCIRLKYIFHWGKWKSKDYKLNKFKMKCQEIYTEAQNFLCQMHSNGGVTA